MWLPPSCFGAVVLMFIFSSIRVLLDKRDEINIQYFGLSVLTYTLYKMWIIQGKALQNSTLVNIVTIILLSLYFFVDKSCSLFLCVNYVQQIYGCDLNEKII